MYVYVSLCFQCFTEKHDHESEETNYESSEDDERSNEIDENLHLSEYEIRRKSRIAANKKRFEERFAAVTAKKVKVFRYTYKKCTLSVMYPL